jgi:hypothetical protein
VGTTYGGEEGQGFTPGAKFCQLFSRIEKDDLGLVVFMAQKMAKGKSN